MSTRRRTRRPPLLAAVAFALLALAAPGRAQERGAGGGPVVLLEARFVDRATGLEAEWGATGQLLLPPPATDPALAHWRGARAVATTPSRQSVAVAAGGTGALRVGREVPFAGWLFRSGARAGLLDRGAEWREVESLLAVEVLAVEPGGTVRLALTPEFGYLHGRLRRSAVFTPLRVEILLAGGEEAALRGGPGQREFYERLLAGYDPLRRVRPVDLLLRASVLGAPPP